VDRKNAQAGRHRFSTCETGSAAGRVLIKMQPCPSDTASAAPACVASLQDRSPRGEERSGRPKASVQLETQAHACKDPDRGQLRGARSCTSGRPARRTEGGEQEDESGHHRSPSGCEGRKAARFTRSASRKKTRKRIAWPSAHSGLFERAAG